ncbi:MAG TPA: sodium:solute symporter [Opitutales bacterium]|jgi:SSS family solute:Na+ symporter|nr:sodium:solute symporter [Opitutales bacterium]
MNALDYIVLLGALLGISAFGMWRTRGRRDLKTYLHGANRTPWLLIGLSVMATQASAITFLSATGQGYQDGLSFVQNYFGMPLALIIVAAVFLPIFRRLNVYTAYEYLSRRFDTKTRLLAAILFLIQRGIGAGITIYAPAIVLSTVFGWRLDLTIILSGSIATAYTVSGGTEAVSLTQKYQMGIIFLGMIIAFGILLTKLSATLTISESFTVAGMAHKLNAVSFSPDLHVRYTIWSGIFGGLFLQLAYFGTDQSQVQRYLSGSSMRESRLGLMFNAVCKIPMQFFILLLGVMIFVFYQVETPPVYFNQSAWNAAAHGATAEKFHEIETKFAAASAQQQATLSAWVKAHRVGSPENEAAARVNLESATQLVQTARNDATDAMKQANTRSKESDYVFITFILDYLPHGLIGLLVAALFAAALNSKAAELNALGATTTVDIYRFLIQRDASDAHCVLATKIFTAAWGFAAIGFALLMNLTENLIEAGNVLGSVFYGGILGVFLVAFFFKSIGGTAVFWGALCAYAIVVWLYLHPDIISYLWLNLIGPVACIIFSFIFQFVLNRLGNPPTASAAP